MDNNKSHGQDDVLQWVQNQQRLREQQQQQQQQQHQDQAGMNATAAVNPVNQDSGSPGHNLGPQPDSTGVTGAEGAGQLPSSIPTMFPGHQLPNSNNTTVPPVVLAQDPSGPSHPLSPQLLMDNGAGLPIVPQQPVQQPIFPAPMGNQGNHQEGGAAWQPGQAAQALGNFQSPNLAPHNEALITPADIQKAAASEQPSLKRPADGAPLGNQPEPKRHDGGGAACNSNQLSIGPTDPAPMSVSERLEKGLIATVASLTQEETDELLLWARRKNMKWREIHERFKFGRAESTLRVRYRDLVKSRPPKVPKFTERDLELLREAVEYIAGGPVHDVDNIKNKKIKGLWVKVQEYIAKHGGTTQAGPWKLKKKYAELMENESGTHKDPKKSKAKRGHKAADKGITQGSQEPASDGGVEQEQPAAESSTRGDAASLLEPTKLKWNHKEYEKYVVDYEEDADFGEDNEETVKEDDGEKLEWNDEEYEQYDMEDEDGADFGEDW